ncbi:carbohydrate ABC transporter permease ['Camptotheca acuminata' phytoplasma]|uniref:carbohydrate ABC transporter permease n=1 Tax='Camptotheca acuminata' phytoplasma TaxID=3239192 RepID=UPI00351AAE59
MNFIDQKKNKSWLYIISGLIVLTIFIFFPLTQTFIISLNSNYNKFDNSLGINKGELFSLKNYINVFKNEEFLIAFRNTLILVFLIVPISVFFSLGVALVLNSIKNTFFKNSFKTFFFLPLVSNTVIMGMIFSILFYYSYGISSRPEGLFNSFIGLFGMKRSDFVTRTAPFTNKMFVLVLYNVWTKAPFKIFVFILALQEIDKSYYDAAKIDGASKWRIFKKITLPLITSVIFYQSIIEMLSVFKEYESVIGLFGDNPPYEIQTIVGYIYKQLNMSTFDSFSKGAAASIILFLISIVFTLISLSISNKKNK